jgi:two-component system, OmpR family, sensor histidine kinase VanS
VTVAVTALGWAAAAGALAVAVAARAELAARMERLARASHELRRPLTAARLAAHALAGANGDWPARAATLERELIRAGRLLGDLDAVRGVAGVVPAWPMEMRAVQVGALLLEVAEGFGGGLVIEPTNEAVVVRGDADRLVQAIGNLVANALEHGAGPVRLDARAEDDRVQVRVSDAGPGLQASLDELTAGAHGGGGRRGRGLAIVAEIARAHGGVLRAEARAPGPFDARRPEAMWAAPVAPRGACLVLDLPRAARPVAVR